MNNLIYYTEKPIELADIRKIAETNTYKCTSYKLVLEDGSEAERLNIHFEYEEDGEQSESHWQWLGGPQYGYSMLESHLDKFEGWRQDRYREHKPESGFVINYHLFSIPYLVQFMLQVMKSHDGWVEDAFSDTMYTVSNIDTLPTATAAYLLMMYQDEQQEQDD